ncbi:MAG TPA: lipopolysaccharide biosynthesis protein [Pyrinomonadaceae bacterium]|jgi:O-antigen/teichoic acid export membrane protein
MRANLENELIWRRFRRNASVSVVGSGLSLALKLGQTALLTKLLRIDDYGRLLIALNLFVFLDSFFGLRVSDVMFRFFPVLQEQKERETLQGLLIVCLGICLASGLIIYGGVVVASPWVSDRLYPNLALTPLFNIYGCTVLISAFTGLYEPILRIHDRFASIVVPQVLGSLVTLVCLAVYLEKDVDLSVKHGYNLKVIVAIFAVGALVQNVPPLVQALRLVKPFLSGVNTKPALRALARYRSEVVGCLVNSNLSGYLKFAISPGDLFLLGLFSSPAQTALYGLAKQLTAPLALLQTNIQTAIMPEITALAAKRRFERLKLLVSRYLTLTFVVSSILLIPALLLGRLLIVSWVQPEYVAALPVFYALTLAAWLMLVLVVFRPLAVSLDLLRWHSLALLASAGIVALFIVAGKLNALTMAYCQLIEVLVLRSLFSGMVWLRLKKLEVSQTIGPREMGDAAPSGSQPSAY